MSGQLDRKNNCVVKVFFFLLRETIFMITIHNGILFSNKFKRKCMEQENILYEITQIQKITPNMFPHNLEASFYMYLYE